MNTGTTNLINVVTLNFIRVATLSLLSIFATSCMSSHQVVLHPIISETDIPIEAIAPAASDGFIGEAFLRKPPGNGPFPAVVLIHGGGPRWPTQELRDYAGHIHASRFLEAGYVVVVITRRDLDFALPPGEDQAPVADAIAVIDYVKELPYVDPQSVVVRGTSVGSYLTLEVAAARDVAAIMVEEPFSMPFVGAGVFPDSDTVLNTDKLERLNKPILLVRGDQTPNINDFNRDYFIPALRAADKSLQVLTYPGELHSFAFYDSPERTLHPDVALEAFKEIDTFFRKNISTQPSPLDSALVQHEAISSD